MSSRGAVPGSAAVKQEGNISREVSEGPRKEKEHHVGQLFPSMQHRAEIRGVQEDVPEPRSRPPLRSPPYQPVILHEVQSKVFRAAIPTTLGTF